MHCSSLFLKDHVGFVCVQNLAKSELGLYAESAQIHMEDLSKDEIQNDVVNENSNLLLLEIERSEIDN